MAFITKKRLGDILVEEGKISEEQLKKALSEQRKIGEKLGKVLIRLGYIKEDDIIEALSRQLKIPFIDLSKVEIEKEILRILDEDFCRRHHLIPVKKEGSILYVAMTDPLDIFAIDEIVRMTGLEVDPMLAKEEDITKALDKHYGKFDLLQETVKEIKKEEVLEYDEFKGEEEVTKLKDFAQEAPVIRFVNNMITQAVLDGASDIHIEPEEGEPRVRFRIDGLLTEVTPPPKSLLLPVISRIKIMSGMDIAKTRVPQDGRIDMRVNGRDVGIRVSTFPTLYGENVVMRILDKSAALYGIEKIGLFKDEQEKLEKVIKKPYGLILVTGPTGSGKTTTLYAILNRLNSVERNIITIEDPVEYTISGIRQSQVNPKAGLDFANGLRSILRQDPDVIMVGEIRDKETATIAIQAALTGHLVLSTLHTNDAPSAITRLIDMGIEPFLISSSLLCVIAQRLVRKICEKCKISFKPNPLVLKEIGLEKEDILLYKGKGCDNCKEHGYKGRTGVFEILIINDEIRELTMAKSSVENIRKAAIKAGMKTMREDGIRKATEGITTLEEAINVTMMDF